MQGVLYCYEQTVAQKMVSWLQCNVVFDNMERTSLLMQMLINMAHHLAINELRVGGLSLEGEGQGGGWTFLKIW